MIGKRQHCGDAPFAASLRIHLNQIPRLHPLDCALNTKQKNAHPKNVFLRDAVF
jgi:hypothetical protein